VPSPPPRLPASAAALVAALTFGAQLLHALGTHRLPRDLNFAWAPLPGVTHDLERGVWPLIAHRLIEPGGWMNVLLGGWLHLVGPSGVAFRLAMLLWLPLLWLVVWRIAARRSGSWGALAAVATVAQVPVIALTAREGWIHVPEAALVAAAAATLLADPKVERRSTGWLAALTGALAIALRPSGLGWVGALGLAWVVGARPPWRRVVGVALAWAVASAIPLPLLPSYLGGKAAIRERYAIEVGGLATQLRVGLGWGVAALATVALGLFVARRLRAGRGVEVRPATLSSEGESGRFDTLLLGSWLVLPFVLFGVTGAGLDNFPLLHVAISLGVAHALRATPAAVWLAVASWAVVTTWQVSRDREEPEAAAPRVAALLDEACPERRARAPCVIVADQGLFFPGSEEPGRLELFLAREEGVRFVSLHRPGMAAAANAVVTWDCAADRTGHTHGADRMEGRDRALAGLTELIGLVPLWQGPLEGCTYTWWKPTRKPAVMPGGGPGPDRGPPGVRAPPGLPPAPGSRAQE
jgi:hypothetical protein